MPKKKKKAPGLVGAMLKKISIKLKPGSNVLKRKKKFKTLGLTGHGGRTLTIKPAK